jgi:hypothetical protein
MRVGFLLIWLLLCLVIKFPPNTIAQTCALIVIGIVGASLGFILFGPDPDLYPAEKEPLPPGPHNYYDKERASPK